MESLVAIDERGSVFEFGPDTVATLDHLTIVGSGVAITTESSSTVTLVSSIVAYNDVGVQALGSTPVLEYCDVYSNDVNWVDFSDPTGLDGNQSVDPEYISWTDDANPANDDVHLTPTSPAIDAGARAERDVDGSRADMGADGGPNGS